MNIGSLSHRRVRQLALMGSILLSGSTYADPGDDGFRHGFPDRLGFPHPPHHPRHPHSPPLVEWPIANEVFTTAEQQVLPVGLSSVDTPPINPADVPLYEPYGYSLWRVGVGLPHVKRTELAPEYGDAPNVARLLSFFSISDIHIADKESPAQPIYIGWSAVFGPSSAGLSSAYSPVILSTTQVLDAAVQTINALHNKKPFDFGIALGDAVNNSQYNELRWYIDVLDGNVVIPSSGAHAGARSIDYQKPYKAGGLEKSIPWFQVIGNHDQFWMGSSYEDAKTQQAHVGNTVLNMNPCPDASAGCIDQTGAYMGVVDGSTYYGDVVGVGLQETFTTPPTVVADWMRHSLSTQYSSSLNWMGEFFNTTSNPVGHGFTQSNLTNDFTSYSFEPKSTLPLKVIALDDTCKGAGQPNYARACLDQTRLGWLQAELQEGQDNNKLMIIAAHVPIHPQQTQDPNSGNYPLFSNTSIVDDASLLAILHQYPNLILWISGHRHVNVVTPQPYDPSIAGQGPQNSFWEVETSSLRDFPQQFRTFDIRRNSDNTLSILVTDVDPAVADGSPAEKSRGYAIGAARIFGATDAVLADTTSHAYNAELVKQLTPEMQAEMANLGSPLE
ncbi:TIGR03768 family metallophosphoesterase [Thiocystis violacea]|uniref:TIGR03768 family metallophosphoesterase n=1 Tax=Thiocystis violacea TaxID=13725 RepID=UPI0019065C51|nr:TIGR03768 family metallophosphoesterase [Thiocystis violacea]MBK1716376.1 TIGR03768 family metallophosphoesterase [Thiocystis violacea]